MEYVLYGLNNQKCCLNRSMSANKLYSTNQCIVTSLFSQSVRHLSSPQSSLSSFTMSALSSYRSTDQRCWVAWWQRRGGSGGGFDYELQKSSHWVNSVHWFGGGGVVVEAAAVDFGCWLVGRRFTTVG